MAIPSVPVQPAPIPAPVVVLPATPASATDFTLASNSGLIAALAA